MGRFVCCQWRSTQRDTVSSSHHGREQDTSTLSWVFYKAAFGRACDIVAPLQFNCDAYQPRSSFSSCCVDANFWYNLVHLILTTHENAAQSSEQSLFY